MEKKRKLPARAAARSEQAAKKRNVTPRERSETPAAPPPPSPPPKEPTPPPPLPQSIEVGKPLPTVEVAQAENLSANDFQSVGESGVLAESLNRSRHKWINDGLFAKYWTKPHKRKGVLQEDPKNPPKESMTKVGTVTITIEPHIIEATMYVVKDPKPKGIPASKQQQRPIIQYGPPNGSMPPPRAPASVTATPTSSKATLAKPLAPSTVQSPAPAPSQSLPKPPPQSAAPPTASPNISAGYSTNNTSSLPSPSYPPRPQAPGPSIAPPTTPSQTPQVTPTPPQGPVLAPVPPSSSTAAPAPTLSQAPPVSGVPNASPSLRPPSGAQTATVTGPTQPATPTTAPATPSSKPTPNDPVIALLAQKAAADVELRELMRRVAMGKAREGELEHFQKIIDQLNLEYRSRGGQQGPSADRLLVDGRTVKYFADEVRTILDIVLASNPNQKSSELRPPPRSDPLVVLLVKTALEDQRTKDMIRRIAEGRPGFTDATDLKEILDRLHRDMRTAPRASPAPALIRQQTPNGIPNGHAKPTTPQTASPANSQALRSKGPPAPSKPDVNAVVFDFGTGDRYMFPKFSILEYTSAAPGQQVIASFLLVRKGSNSEYGGDPQLDYYQPVSIRLQSATGRHLEYLARVVAPQDEVRQYMDDVMDNMTRAEYVLLAMRLPRGLKDDEKDNASPDETKANGSTPKSEEPVPAQRSAPKPSVLWTTKGSSETPPLGKHSLRPARDPELDGQARYQRLISSVAAKDV
ncbi:hypothetical protein BGZ63DRAFT_399155 [Mariannaea sp. PMI_226]|nr:hypothetical protein BGZ63DRAFT_399155 [Mariannaea sp. PMI_226]